MPLMASVRVCAYRYRYYVMSAKGQLIYIKLYVYVYSAEQILNSQQFYAPTQSCSLPNEISDSMMTLKMLLRKRVSERERWS